jgi:hypothetical protein
MNVLKNYLAAAQLAAFQEELSSMEVLIMTITRVEIAHLL